MSIPDAPIFQFGGMSVRYPLDPHTGRIGFQLVPTALEDRMATRRTTLRGEPFIDVLPGEDLWPAVTVDSLVQVKLLGDPYTGGFAAGHTMRNAPSLHAFRFERQEVHHEGGETTVVTTLKSAPGQRLEHRLSWREGDTALEVRTGFFNDSAEPVTLEMLASYSLGGITPFASDDAPERLRVHRFRSGWAAEGRLETRSIEQLHLERSWSGTAAFCERFGQVGTMPVRKWFPFVAVEDAVARVVWGARLAWAGSWQMEIFRQHDDVCLSGGLADREFGHWMKTLAPGESLITPTALLACVHGTLDDVCDRLTAMQQRAVATQPENEEDLPIVFNEFCTSWGDPQHHKLVTVADRLRGAPVRYLVIDAGWYRSDAAHWDGAHGDWTPSVHLFPEGLEATAAAIHERGLIPGLWFEMETVGENSAAFSLVDHLLKRDGRPLTVRGRRFWDFNDPWVEDYLTEKVIRLLERCRFGYLKVDYNETVGIGCDHPDSIGEGLRQQVLGSYRFFEKIREHLPDLVIENCSSGGHRLEPSMLARTAMSSFSDAHEMVEIPIIAANLHRLILPRQSQIWAVLHRSDSPQRLAYSLAATFLGRMCLSGGIDELSQEQWALAERAMRLYRRAVPVIKHGSSRLFGEMGQSWRYPRGYQAVVRTGGDRRQALIVLHTFKDAPDVVDVPLPEGPPWTVVTRFAAEGSPEFELRTETLRIPTAGDFRGQMFLLAGDKG